MSYFHGLIEFKWTVLTEKGLLDPTANSDIESQRSYSTFRNPSEGEDSYSDSEHGSTRTRINPRIVSDAILGMSDGLTVPFALSAGLSALGDTRVVVLGGLAELMAGAISMGLGGYVGAKSEGWVSSIPSLFCLAMVAVELIDNI